MAKTTTWKFVTPKFVASQRNNTFKTANQVKTFAVKNQVSCGWIKTAGTSSRHFLIEVNSFQKAYTNFAKSAASNGSKTSSPKSKGYTAKSSSKTSRFGKIAKARKSSRQRGWTSTRSTRRAA